MFKKRKLVPAFFPLVRDFYFYFLDDLDMTQTKNYVSPTLICAAPKPNSL